MKIGFACKWLHPNRENLSKKDLAEKEEAMNTKSTTIQWLGRQPRQSAERRLMEIAEHNAKAVVNVLNWLENQNDLMRMFRISSDLLPAYTHPEWRDFYQSQNVQDHLESIFAPIGTLARDKDIKLSFHPGQFVVLASDRPEVVDRSIEEFEYHAIVARWMGYGKEFQDFKCNVHISGRLGPSGVVAALKRMTPEARNIITIENDEMTYGIEHSLELKDHLALVLDIHHHFVKTGEYIAPDDDRVKKIQESWRGRRPTLHYSYSRDEHLGSVQANEMPDLNRLVESGVSRQKLRAHSEFYPNSTVNRWALSFLENFDIMCECKQKNRGAQQLIDICREDK